MSIWAEEAEVFSALFSGSAWKMKDAFNADGMWLFCFFVTISGGILANLFYKALPFVDRHLERGISVVAYLMIAGIIFWGVIDRVWFSRQGAGSTTVPPFLFMIMAWFGCSYNVKLRADNGCAVMAGLLLDRDHHILAVHSLFRRQLPTRRRRG